MSQFVLRTEKLGPAKYFAGTVDLPMDIGVVLTPVIFGAYIFDSQADAEEAVAAMVEYDFTISACEFGASENLGGEE